MLFLVVHGDLDGLAAAAIYIVLSGSREYEVRFAEPTTLHRELGRVKAGAGDRVVIADLGVNRPNLGRLEEVLRVIRSRGASIEWYDHHVWDEAWLERLGSYARIVVDTSTCGAGVVYSYAPFRKRDGRFERLVEAVCAADLWRFDRWEAPWLYRYAAYRGDRGWSLHVLEKFVAYLSGVLEELVDDEVGDVVAAVAEREVEEVSQLLRDMVRVRVGGIELGFALRRGSVPESSILGAAMLGRGVDIAVVLNRGRSISFRSARCNVRELAAALGGGGHPRAAGAPAPLAPLLRLLVLVGLGRAALSVVVRRVTSVLRELAGVC